MAIPQFLAMTAEEFAGAPLPDHPAWMACHFAPYGRGLCNLPESLPDGSLLILNDRIPIRSHDRGIILSQLQEILGKFRCYGVLLDFEQAASEALADLTEFLCRSLPCPVCTAPAYAQAGRPVLLSIPPHQISHPEGQEVWLDLSPSSEIITLTKQGAAIAPADAPEGLPFAEESLLCHYGIQVDTNNARFTLTRTWEDLEALAEYLGAAAGVGLYQELNKKASTHDF